MSVGLFFKIIAMLLAAVMGWIPSQLGIPVGDLAPSIIFDAQELTGEVTNGASGYLYGLAQDGVPSYNMTESLDISSVSAKTQGGLQHPIGEVGDIAPQLTKDGACDYIVVYLQDMFSTWYYDEAAINEMKKNGEYDAKEYLVNVYFPLVRQTVELMKNEEYADKLVYCIFNECDNGVWFGDWIDNGDGSGRNSFNENGARLFNECWKLTYDYVRSLDPGAKIGGPGNYEYSEKKTEDFLSYAAENGCAPDALIYHELGDRSVYDWQANVDSARALLKKYSLNEDMPIIITEYGRMQDNGNPSMMAKYVIAAENSKVYANQAYWLLANNLCSTCADYNTPNSAWWVYRRYTSMNGQTMAYENRDILHSDLEKAFKQGREPRFQQFTALGVISDEGDKISVLASGADYNGRIAVKNLKGTALYGERVKVSVEAITYQGIEGAVISPQTVKTYTTVCYGSIGVNLEMDEDTAYFITIEKTGERQSAYNNTNLFTRYEAEHGELLGAAYTYDSAYATTGEINGMVGGMESVGDGVKLTVNARRDGEYLLRIICGNSCDGSSYTDRTNTLVSFMLDGEYSDTLTLRNTIKSELTYAYDMKLTLTKGKHELTFMHDTGTFVLDSVLLKLSEDETAVYAEKDDDRENSVLAVAASDGYYKLGVCPGEQLSIDGAPASADENGSATVYLRRGLNYIDRSASGAFYAEPSGERAAVASVSAEDMLLSDGAYTEYNETAQKSVLKGVSSEGGSASFTVTAPYGGTYKLTLEYASNREGGVHSYNVDLIEDFVTLAIGGEEQSFYTRSTYSSDSFTTVTVNISLSAGENTVTISNNGCNKFNGGETFIPEISALRIYETAAD